MHHICNMKINRWKHICVSDSISEESTPSEKLARRAREARTEDVIPGDPGLKPVLTTNYFEMDAVRTWVEQCPRRLAKIREMSYRELQSAQDEDQVTSEPSCWLNGSTVRWMGRKVGTVTITHRNYDDEVHQGIYQWLKDLPETFEEIPDYDYSLSLNECLNHELLNETFGRPETTANVSNPVGAARNAEEPPVVIDLTGDDDDADAGNGEHKYFPLS